MRCIYIIFFAVLSLYFLTPIFYSSNQNINLKEQNLSIIEQNSSFVLTELNSTQTQPQIQDNNTSKTIQEKSLLEIFAFVQDDESIYFSCEKKDENTSCNEAKLDFFINEIQSQSLRAIQKNKDSFIFENSFYLYEFIPKRHILKIKNKTNLLFSQEFVLHKMPFLKTSLTQSKFKPDELVFESSNLNLEKKLFDDEMKLFSDKKHWQLWRDNSLKNYYLHTLINSTWYLYQNEFNKAFLSDELSITLQKKDKDFFIAFVTPKHYKKMRILDLKHIENLYIFKLDGLDFMLVAEMINAHFTQWWKIKLDAMGVRAKTFGTQDPNALFSNNTQSLELRLSDMGCKDCNEINEE
ncbi:hypothetical protein DMB91_01605 [Campylobacter sp. MIT 97-5078]|nr:hypothetical protein [Campylobacter sp. MIT 97-5078]KGI56159.1 hypothetical protein LR59_08780 [Campylobacter sp. MIT 97-5078]TQR27956.1 hypothetical protein DMB91_01605 [Campylobacter sp. MIT 97-5078]